MTPKRRLFVDEYLIDLNGSRAYRAAGYAGSDRVCEVESSKLLRNPEVAAAIQAAMDKRAERTELTADYVLSGIREVAERCMERAPVMIGRGESRTQAMDEQGRHVWSFDATGANKAFELLGKHLKLFTDKVEHSGEMSINVLPEDAGL